MNKEQAYKYWESWDTGKERMQQVIKIEDLPPEQQGPSSKRLAAFDAPMAEPSLSFNESANKSQKKHLTQAKKMKTLPILFR